MADLVKLGVVKGAAMKIARQYTGGKTLSMLESNFKSLQDDMANDATRIGALETENAELHMAVKNKDEQIIILEAEVAGLKAIAQQKVEEVVAEIKPEVEKAAEEIKGEVEELVKEQKEENKILEEIKESIPEPASS